MCVVVCVVLRVSGGGCEGRGVQTSVEIGSITDISADSQGRVEAHVGQ